MKKSFLLPLLLLLINCGPDSRKKSVLAGYKSGSIVNYTIELFEDSTFEMSTLKKGHWQARGDTFLLFDEQARDSVAGMIVHLQGIACNKSYWLIESFRFNHFDPPKAVQFPAP